MNGFTYRGGDGVPLYAATVCQGGVTAGGISGPVLVLLHGGGPDHPSLIPLAELLADLCTVVLPDIRGYGRSICTDPARHTWAQYAGDVVALLDHLVVGQAIMGGAGLGATITLRAAIAYPERVLGSVLISVEDIEDDERKQAEIEFMDDFAARVRTKGIEAAWAPILDDLAPIVGAMVREAIPRSDTASIAAAAAIGRDRAFRSVEELAGIATPALVFPVMDWRHPGARPDPGPTRAGTRDAAGRRERRLVVRGSAVVRLRAGGEEEIVPASDEVIFGDTLFIPPLGAANRVVPGELGRFRLDLGDGYMLHGTPHTESIGTAATHGCIRLLDADIEHLYRHVPVGTPVYVY